MTDVLEEPERQEASLSRFGQTQMTLKQITRFRSKLKEVDLGYVDPDTGEHSTCYIWIGASHDKGYGRFFLGMLEGKRVWAYAHRISYEHHIGPIPPGYVVDHKCNNKACTRASKDGPNHLQAVHDLVNMRLAAERRPWKRRNQHSVE